MSEFVLTVIDIALSNIYLCKDYIKWQIIYDKEIKHKKIIYDYCNSINVQM